MAVSWKVLSKELRSLDTTVICLGQYTQCHFLSSLTSLSRHLGGTLVEAGSDTTSSFTQTLVLALTAFPEVQTKAQAELDRVVGDDRMPTYEDYEKMPYLRAVVNEVHRFRPNAPIIPHAATADVTVRIFYTSIHVVDFLRL
jgi:hypothetical protein